MESFIAFISAHFGESVGVLIFSAIGLCATLAPWLPLPAEGGNKFYKFAYDAFQYLAQNYGKASNAKKTA